MSNKKIYKYTMDNNSSISIPKGAEILSVGAQGSDVCIWATVEPDAEKETEEYSVLGTGWDVPESARCFIGTAQLDNGLVFHVFCK